MLYESFYDFFFILSLIFPPLEYMKDQDLVVLALEVYILKSKPFLPSIFVSLFHVLKGGKCQSSKQEKNRGKFSLTWNKKVNNSLPLKTFQDFMKDFRQIVFFLTFINIWIQGQRIAGLLCLPNAISIGLA